MDSHEHAIYRAAIQGDRDSFEMIIRSSSRNAFAIAYGILQSREEAEDVVQDSLVKAWKMRWRVRDPEKFSRLAQHDRSPSRSRCVPQTAIASFYSRNNRNNRGKYA